MKFRLETNRMIIREFTFADADLLSELDNDPEVMRFVNGGIPVPRTETVNDILPSFIGYYQDGRGYGFWAAIERYSDRFRGWFHLRPEHGSDALVPELGYRLHRFAWNRGLATEGSIALIDYGFRQLGCEGITAQAMIVNVASIRVMQKAGMREIRRFHADWPVRIPGDELGDVEYAIDRSEWESRTSAASK